MMWRGKKRKTVLLCCLVGSVALTFGAEAQGFYWPGWPGVDGTPIEGSMPPAVTFEPNAPPHFPPIIDGLEPTPEQPPSVPEPSTILAALTGLSAMLGYRRWRNRPA